MSYSISIGGHKDVQSAGESEQFLEEIKAKTKEFAENLEGCTSAAVNGVSVLEQPAQEG